MLLFLGSDNSCMGHDDVSCTVQLHELSPSRLEVLLRVMMSSEYQMIKKPG